MGVKAMLKSCCADLQRYFQIKLTIVLYLMLYHFQNIYLIFLFWDFLFCITRRFFPQHFKLGVKIILKSCRMDLQIYFQIKFKLIIALYLMQHHFENIYLLFLHINF